jgi:hydroxymethylbilane synthase
MRCEATTMAVAAERGALTALEGSCRTAVGAHARLSGRRLSLIVEALTPDGVAPLRREDEVELGADAETDARDLGLRVGEAVGWRRGSHRLKD